MPSPKNTVRRGGGHQEQKNRKGRLLTEKASSFHGMKSSAMVAPDLRRQSTLPELLEGKRVAGSTLTKLLIKVTPQGGVGALQVLMSPESTVGDLIASAVKQYDKEGRRPILPTIDPSGFDLHYSQFSLESLGREEKLKALGSRNFFLYPRKNIGEESDVMTSFASCSKEAGGVAVKIPWLKFMDFLL